MTMTEQRELSPPTSMRAQVASGVRWGVADQAYQQVARLAVTVTLARLVAPRDFGLAGMALVIVFISSFIGDLGLGPALVQRRRLEPAHLAVTLSVSTLIGLVLTDLVVITASPVAGFFGQPRLVSILPALSPLFLLKGAQATPRWMLQRYFLFRPLAIASIVGVTGGGAIGVVLAVLHQGVWALVGYALGEAVFQAVATAVVAYRRGVWTPSWGFELQALKDVFGFGANVTGFRLLFYAQNNADNVLVGRYLGAAALGYYDLAYTAMLFPIQKIADVVGNVTLPALARLQGDPVRLQNAMRRAIEAVTLICFPLSIGILMTASLAVPEVFGGRWHDAIVPLELLSLNGPRLAVVRLNKSVYQAVGRPSWALWTSFAGCCLYIPGFVVGVHFGVTGVAAGYTIAGFVLFPLELWLGARCIGQSILGFLAPAGPILLATGVMAAAIAGARGVRPGAGAVTLALAIVVGTAAYLVALQVLRPGLVSSTLADLLRPERRPAPAPRRSVATTGGMRP